MSKFRTPKNKRTTYIYCDANGNKILELKPGENGITQADIAMLHRAADDEWNNNYKQVRAHKTNPNGTVSIDVVDPDGVSIGSINADPLKRIVDEETNNNLQDDTNESNVDETTEEDKPEKKGGSYGEVFKKGEGDKCEVHHMPADSASDLERNDGSAIKMDKEDHRQTASCGSSREAREYRAAQKELIEHGKFREALQMDIDDIHEKFGDKYDDAIAEMLEYVDKLEEEGRIDG
ncbi:hypothetical protein [Clostridium estertheticum]|uniref:Uncharacterized protein n=1 Tax=Clostridium estertheticum TaxID=238834 RepID=A0A7Y3SYW5_9CLOT|nr:hypothetical protein [Clostridium estertheticum]NNU76339.1 hypothetical protein [Clostridium estertheticum]WBL45834.1 hypothetical protein LOR37_14200 [Clostridium estertheticum]